MVSGTPPKLRETKVRKHTFGIHISKSFKFCFDFQNNFFKKKVRKTFLNVYDDIFLNLGLKNNLESFKNNKNSYNENILLEYIFRKL